MGIQARARIYATENYDYRIVLELRQCGREVLTAREVGHAGQGIPDADVLAFAVSQGRAVLTFNRRHLMCLHRMPKSLRGIIICTDHPDIVTRRIGSIRTFWTSRTWIT